MKTRLGKAVTGLAAGAVLTAPVLGVFALGSLAGIPSVPYNVFEWFIRVLPGRLVIFGLETTLRVLEGLGFNIKNTAKTTEEVLALTSLLLAGWVVGLLFFALIRTSDRQRVRNYGRAVGAAVGIFSLVLVFIEAQPMGAMGAIGVTIWVLGVFLLWGWGLARLYLLAYPSFEDGRAQGAAVAEPVPPAAQAPRPPVPAAAAGSLRGGQVPAEVTRISRRSFVIQVGGLAATILVLGTELAEVLSVEGGPAVTALVKAPIPFPNADSPVKPVPGTRPEYTPVADHYRVDIDLSAPQIDAASWRLRISGLVGHPLTLTLDQLKVAYKPMDQFITLSCISNPLGGPLIGTTLWTGPSFGMCWPRRPRCHRRAGRTCSRKMASTRSSTFRRSWRTRASRWSTPGTGSRCRRTTASPCASTSPTSTG